MKCQNTLNEEPSFGGDIAKHIDQSSLSGVNGFLCVHIESLSRNQNPFTNHQKEIRGQVNYEETD